MFQLKKCIAATVIAPNTPEITSVTQLGMHILEGGFTTGFCHVLVEATH